eukprot:UN03825
MIWYICIHMINLFVYIYIYKRLIIYISLPYGNFKNTSIHNFQISKPPPSQSHKPPPFTMTKTISSLSYYSLFIL